MAFEKFVPVKAQRKLAPPAVSLGIKSAIFNLSALKMLHGYEGNHICFSVGIYIEVTDQVARIGLDAKDVRGNCRVSSNGISSTVGKALRKLGAEAGSRFALTACDLPPVTHEIVVRKKK